jgi:hypothetical protein
MENVALEKNMHAYETLRPYLERIHLGKWLVFHDARLISSSDSFAEASKDASDRFGNDACLVHQVTTLISN